MSKVETLATMLAAAEEARARLALKVKRLKAAVAEERKRAQRAEDFLARERATVSDLTSKAADNEDMKERAVSEVRLCRKSLDDMFAQRTAWTAERARMASEIETLKAEALKHKPKAKRRA